MTERPERAEHRAVISGVGQSAIGRQVDRSGLQLTLDAILAAVADAGLDLDDVDGLAMFPGGGAANLPGYANGNLYEVRVDITVPGEEIVVTREPSPHTEYRDIHVALRDAFDSARRQLEDYVRRRRGAVKALDTAPHARVSKLVPLEGYGFLQTPDGREVYFHRHSVLHEAFDRLEIGTEVAFVEEAGKKGPQASTVRPVGKHGHL